jgi:hypothetical protein
LRTTATKTEFQENRTAKNTCRRKKKERERKNLEETEAFAEKKDMKQVHIKTGQIKTKVSTSNTTL